MSKNFWLAAGAFTIASAAFAGPALAAPAAALTEVTSVGELAQNAGSLLGSIYTEGTPDLAGAAWGLIPGTETAGSGFASASSTPVTPTGFGAGPA